MPDSRIGAEIQMSASSHGSDVHKRELSKARAWSLKETNQTWEIWFCTMFPMVIVDMSFYILF